MSKREWVEEWFDGGRYGVDYMTVSEADRDLKMFRDDDMDIPEDLTGEEFAEIWNELCDRQCGVWE